MLEFIVLGNIPGTHLQITLAWFIAIVFGALVWLDIKLHSNFESRKDTPRSFVIFLSKIRR